MRRPFVSVTVRVDVPGIGAMVLILCVDKVLLRPVDSRMQGNSGHLTNKVCMPYDLQEFSPNCGKLVLIVGN